MNKVTVIVEYIVKPNLHIECRRKVGNRPWEWLSRDCGISMGTPDRWQFIHMMDSAKVEHSASEIEQEGR